MGGHPSFFGRLKGKIRPRVDPTAFLRSTVEKAIDIIRSRGLAPGKPQERELPFFRLVARIGEKLRVLVACGNRRRRARIAQIEQIEHLHVGAFGHRETFQFVYPYGELDELVLCYATTIHKSQGSEYPIVVLPITMQHYVMLKRNLIYTGVTRGKKLVILVGQKKALAMAVRGKQTITRNTGLKHCLQNENPTQHEF